MKNFFLKCLSGVLPNLPTSCSITDVCIYDKGVRIMGGVGNELGSTASRRKVENYFCGVFLAFIGS